MADAQGSLPINLRAAMNMVQSSRTNTEKIDNLNKFVEEFYKTIGILLLSRYTAAIRDTDELFDQDILNLIEDFFFEPSFNDWILLCKLCGDQLSDKGDEFAAQFSKAAAEKLEDQDARTAKKILVEINNVKGSAKFDPPKKIRLAQVLEITRELRNFTSHEWTSNSHLACLIESKIDTFILRRITELVSHFQIKFFKVLSKKDESLEICEYNGINKSIYAVPFPFDQYPDLYLDHKATYIVFDPNEDWLRYFTHLIKIDEEPTHLLVYNKSKAHGKNLKVKYEILPLAGEIKKETRDEFGRLFDLFSIPYDVDVQQTIETASQKYGVIQENNEIIHNLVELSPTYIERERIEQDLYQKIIHPKLYITSLDGGGGFGKTELTKKVIWDIINDEKGLKRKFTDLNYVIWLSAKNTHFEKGKIVEKSSPFNNLEDLLDCIFYVTKNSKYLTKPFSEKKDKTVEIFNKFQQNIIILDNLETVSDIKPILDYIDQLGREVKTDTKVIVTSRVLDFYPAQRLHVLEMEPEESKDLVIRELKRLDILNHYQAEGQVEKIAEVSANIPLLIKHFINLLFRGYSFRELEKDVPLEYERALDFICDYQWNGLSNDSKKLLLGIAKNDGRLSFVQAKLLCNFTDSKFSEARTELLQSSFLTEDVRSNSLLETLSPITSFVSRKLGEFPELTDEFDDRMGLIKVKSNISIDSGIGSYFYSDEIALNNLLQKADMLERRGETTQAYKFIIEAVDRFQGNALAWNSKGEFEFKNLEDDEKARESFEKAINLDPKNAKIYNRLAYWERDRGMKEQNLAYLETSITLNEEALKNVESESDKRVFVDHIASAYNKMAYITKQEAFRARADPFRARESPSKLFESADNYFQRVIELLSVNTIGNPLAYEEIRHNILDYQMMINANIQMGGKRDSNRDFYDAWATLMSIRALKLGPDNEKIKALFSHRAIEVTLNRFGLSSRVDDADFLEQIIPIEERLQNFLFS